MLRRRGDRHRLAEFARHADVNAELELEIEMRDGPKLGAASSGRLRWPLGRLNGVPLMRTEEARL